MKPKLKCYISAPANFDISPIELILDEIGIEHHSFYDFSIGTTFSDLIFRKIRDSDFVVSVLKDDNSNVFFETGVANGLGKPSFLLIDKEFKLPYYFSGKLFYQTNFKDWSLIKFGLQGFIKDVKRKPQKTLPFENTTLDVDATSELLIRINQIRKNPNHDEIIDLIKNIFSSLNIFNFSVDQPVNDRGVDLIIQSKNVNPYFSYPILVELKAGNLDPQSIKNAQTTISKSLSNAEARAGLILYLDKQNKRFSGEYISPLIFCFDLEDFIDGIASIGFEKLLIDQRNQLAHGHI